MPCELTITRAIIITRAITTQLGTIKCWKISKELKVKIEEGEMGIGNAHIESIKVRKLVEKNSTNHSPIMRLWN